MKKLLILLTLTISFSLHAQSLKISEMSAVSSLTGAELFPAVQSGANKKATFTDMITGMPDASASLRGFMTTSAQTIAGAKSFTGRMKIGTSTQFSTLDTPTKGLYSVYDGSASSGTVINSLFGYQQTAAKTGASESLLGFMITANSTGTIATAIGSAGTMDHEGNGTVTDGRAMQGSVLLQDGTLTNAYGLYSDGFILGTGTIGTYAGLYIKSLSVGSGSVTNNYGIYQEGGSPKNYFQGSVGIGTSSPGANLHVSGTVRYTLGSDGTGDLYYRSALGGDLGRLGIGSSGNVLTVAAGLPSWGTGTTNLATGTSGSDIAWSLPTFDLGGTATLNIPDASATARGALSTSDWSTFNAKESALTFSSPLSRSVNTISLGTVGVGNGGTGLTSIAAKSIWVANSASTITSVTPGAGQSVRINAGNTAWEAYTPASGITNSAISNELMKSDGTNAVASGLYSSTTGNLNLGLSTSSGSTRTMTADGSSSNVGLTIATKNSGLLTLSTGNSCNLQTSNSVLIENTTPSTSIPVEDLIIRRATTGLSADGIGSDIVMNIENSGGSYSLGARLETLLADADVGSGVDSYFILNLTSNGTEGEKIRIENNGDFGLTTNDPDRRFHVEEDNASNNSVTYTSRETHTTSGTPAIGIGIGKEWEVETSPGNNEIGFIEEAVTTDATAGSEDFDRVFKLMKAGASAAEVLRIISTGGVKYVSNTLLGTASAGLTEYNDAFYDTKGSGLRYGRGGVIFDNYTDANNSGTGETDLYTYTTPAGTLATDGGKITAKYVGTFNDITATEQLKVKFGGATIFDSGALTISAAGSWELNLLLIRTSSTTVRAAVTMVVDNATLSSPTTYTAMTGLTLSGTNILKVTGTAGGGTGGSNDITAVMGTGSWFPAANN